MEVYDLDNPALSKLANISTRGFVDTGDKVLIGGIIVGGSGANVIIHAIGPSLADAGVTGALMDPTLEIHGADGSLLFSTTTGATPGERDRGKRHRANQQSRVGHRRDFAVR